MKTHVLAFALLTALMAALLSCTKEKPDTNTTNPTPGDDRLIGQVHWFMDAAQDVKDGKMLKDGEKMLIDSALYYISTTLNYKYCFPGSNFGISKSDTSLVKIPILASEGKTLLVDALSAYNLSVEKVRLRYRAITSSNKHLLACVVQNAGVTPGNDTIIARVISQTGYGAPIANTGFGSNDQYWWSINGGNCVDPNYTEPGMGAPEVLAGSIYNHGWWPQIQSGYRMWFSDPVIKPYNDPTQYAATGTTATIDNFCDYKFYYATEYYNGSLQQPLEDKVFCLGLEVNHPGIHEMEFYNSNMADVFLAFLNGNGRNFMNIEILDDWDQYSVPGGTATQYYHNYKHIANLTHGVMHIESVIGYPNYID
jgi:hypothetical protein